MRTTKVFKVVPSLDVTDPRYSLFQPMSCFARIHWSVDWFRVMGRRFVASLVYDPSLGAGAKTSWKAV